MKPQDGEIVFQAESKYSDLFLRKNLKMRLTETALFILGMMILSLFIDTQTWLFKILVIILAIAIVGLAPFVYKAVLRPHYLLTKTHLFISIANRKRKIPLAEIEPLIQGRHFYKIQGKRESLMASRQFLAHLDERLALLQRVKKRR